MRVASSDWCASRIVVSVSSTRFCASIHSAKRRGPSSSNNCLLPGGGGESGSGGSSGVTTRTGAGRPRTTGLPLTTVSARNVSTREARSRRCAVTNSSGVSSMKRVV